MEALYCSVPLWAEWKYRSCVNVNTRRSLIFRTNTNLEYPDGDQEGEQQFVLLKETPAHVGVHVVGEEIVEFLQPLVELVAFFAQTNALGTGFRIRQGYPGNINTGNINTDDINNDNINTDVIPADII